MTTACCYDNAHRFLVVASGLFTTQTSVSVHYRPRVLSRRIAAELCLASPSVSVRWRATEIINFEAPQGHDRSATAAHAGVQ